MTRGGIRPDCRPGQEWEGRHVVKTELTDWSILAGQSTDDWFYSEGLEGEHM